MLETVQLTDQRQKTRRIRLCRRRPCRAVRGRPRSTCAAASSSSARCSTRSSTRHDYPEPVARLLAEACVLDGAARHVAEVRRQVHPADPHRRSGRHAGRRFHDAGLAARLCPLRRRAAGRARWRPARRRRETLLGSGVLALTIDQGEHTQRYQGIVAARRRRRWRRRRAPISASRSRSRPRSGCRSPSCVLPGGGSREHWRAGGMLAQFLPEAPERMRMPDLPGGDGDTGIAEDRRSTMPGWNCRRCSAPSSRPN